METYLLKNKGGKASRMVIDMLQRDKRERSDTFYRRRFNPTVANIHSFTPSYTLNSPQFLSTAFHVIAVNELF